MAEQPVAILAGKYTEYLEWQRNNPDIRGIYCNQLSDFAGIKFSKILEIGTFRCRPDALEIYYYVLPRVRIQNHDT